jgi:hypothetical protein
VNWHGSTGSSIGWSVCSSGWSVASFTHRCGGARCECGAYEAVLRFEQLAQPHGDLGVLGQTLGHLHGERCARRTRGPQVGRQMVEGEELKKLGGGGMQWV